MMEIPSNSNSIYISMIPNGCLKAEFDSVYPIHLNGIISQEEFQQSIRNINRTISSNKIALIIFMIVFLLGITSGIICFVVASVTLSNSSRYRFNLLLIVGIILTTIGSLVFSIGMCIVHSRRTNKMRQIIAEESLKYSSRSPTPCSWRLNIMRGWNRGFGYYQNNQPTYNLVIDIGRVINSENRNTVYYSNQTVSEPTTLFGRQDDYTLPPYSAQLTTRFCSQCGATREDLTTKICLSCGQMFNNY